MMDHEFKLTPEQQALLQQALRPNNRAGIYRRAAALLALHNGSTVVQVAQLLGVTRQCVYNWMATYGGTWNTLDIGDRKRSGRPTMWTAELEALLGKGLAQSPRDLGYDAGSWTIRLLQDYLAAHAGRRISANALSRKLCVMGYAVKEGHRYVINALPMTPSGM